MNKTIIFILLTASCMTPIDYNDEYDYPIILDIPEHYLQNEEYLFAYISFNVIYKSDIEIYNRQERWQDPGETMMLLTGDCEDIIILWMYLSNYYFGSFPQLLVVTDGHTNHATGLLYGVIYNNMPGFEKIKKSYDYFEAMYYAKKHYSRR